MASVVFVEKEQHNAVANMFNNTSGADLAVEEFAVIGKIPCVANGVIANNADGAFVHGDGLIIQIADFVNAEDTFGTLSDPVYWDPSTKTFSDTKKPTYKEVGQVTAVKASGVVKITLYGRIPPTLAELVDLSIGSPTNNDTIKFVTATGAWTIVAVAD